MSAKATARFESGKDLKDDVLKVSMVRSVEVDGDGLIVRIVANDRWKIDSTVRQIEEIVGIKAIVEHPRRLGMRRRQQ